MHSQRMTSIVPIVIGCIDYLAYGTIFTHAMFRPKIKLGVFFPARKAGDEPRRVVWWMGIVLFCCVFLWVNDDSATKITNIGVI